ncbi:hypothetical protein [Diaminobutyricibacter sp. McL0608]|uniref:hypothetical protein n=1 Tax=Leifsonia sp. McL0608 TaxID=3143537 RepID=UPI0031F327DB
MIGLTATIVALSACAPAKSPQPAVPEFEGPWATEFAEQFRDADFEFVRDVLRDGKIAEQEYVEMTDRYRKCMNGAGLMTTDFQWDGSSEYTFSPQMGPDRAHAAAMKCSDESGEYPIEYLYRNIKANPENLDTDTIMAACFVRKGVVPPGYDVKQYRRDNDGGAFAFRDTESGRDVYDECAADPLGLIRGQ